MKYRVKIGMEFDDVKITVEKEKQSTFHDWKNLSMLLVFFILIIGVVYAKVTGDTDIFNKTVDAVVKVTTTYPPKENGKEK